MGKYLIQIFRCTSITCFWIESLRSITKDWNKLLKWWVGGWLIASVCILGLIEALSLTASFYKPEQSFYLSIIACVLFYFALSRCNEMIFAFLNDAFDKLPSRGKRSFSHQNEHPSISLRQRVDNAFLSFGELVINFAIMYRLLPPSAWKQKSITVVDGVLKELPANSMGGTLDALYYSVTTITTLGYGDITPQSGVAKFLSMYEVLSGIVLLVFALAVYMTYAGSPRDET